MLEKPPVDINSKTQTPKAESETTLSFVGHLDELRRRLWVMIGTILVATVIGLSISDRLVAWMKHPAGDMLTTLSFFSPPEALMAHLKLSLAFGVVLSVPVVLYEVWMFIRPGLTLQERRHGLGFVVWGTFLFLLGVLFAYTVLLPISLRFLLGFGGRTLQPVISIHHYLSFTSFILLACGTIFEFPLAIFFLTKIGLVTPQQLKRQRKVAFFIMVVVAAIVTPTHDPINLMLMTLPLLFLYEISLWASYLARPREKKDA